MGLKKAAEEQQEAYERLLLDAMVGDSTLFARRDEVETAWGICTPILEAWEGGDLPAPETYEAGTWGPTAAADLIGRSGRRWKRL